jgi:hypothetical protein
MATPNAGFLARVGHSSLELARHITSRFGIRDTVGIAIITIFLVYSITSVSFMLSVVDDL